MATKFIKLNVGWNAEPNAPQPQVERRGTDLTVTFYMNPFHFPQFKEEDVGKLTFKNCWRHRIGATNDEGWSRGKCRFSKLAPEWGELYEIKGDLLLEKCPKDWKELEMPRSDSRHFLFYFRDETFECDAEDWSFEVICD